MSAFAEATARQSSLSSTTRAKTGGKGIRTPGLLIANETLYQLSYTPGQRSENITRWRFVSNRNNEFACVSAIDSNGRAVWIADAHRDDGKRFVVHADEKLTAFLELEATIRDCGQVINQERYNTRRTRTRPLSTSLASATSAGVDT